MPNWSAQKQTGGVIIAPPNMEMGQGINVITAPLAPPTYQKNHIQLAGGCSVPNRTCALLIAAALCLSAVIITTIVLVLDARIPKLYVVNDVSAHRIGLEYNPKGNPFIVGNVSITVENAFYTDMELLGGLVELSFGRVHKGGARLGVRYDFIDTCLITSFTIPGGQAYVQVVPFNFSIPLYEGLDYIPEEIRATCLKGNLVKPNILKVWVRVNRPDATYDVAFGYHEFQMTCSQV